MDFRGAFNAVTKPFRKPEGYVSAKEEQAARPPAPTPPPAQPQMQIGGMNTGATERREKAAGMKDGGMVARGAYRPKMMEGGMVRGPGTGTSDSIPATVRKGSYILPADTTEEVALSNGEMNLPPEAVAAVGAAVLNVVRNATHEFAAGDAAEDAAEGEPHAEGDLMEEDSKGGEDDPRGFMHGGHVGMKRKGYADGDPVGDEAKRIAAGLAPNLNPATSMQVRPEARRPTGIYGTPRPPQPEGTWADAPRPSAAVAPVTTQATPDRPPLPITATETVLRESGADADAAAAKGNYGYALMHGARGLAAAIPAIGSDLNRAIISPAARGIGNNLSVLFTGEPMQDTAPAATTPQPAARPVTPAVAQPATQPDSIRSRGQTIAVPPPAQQSAGGVVSPARGIYGNVTGDTAFDNRGAISPQNDAAATALDARYRQQAAGERAMAEQAAAADPRAILMGQLKSMADRNQTFSARGAQVLSNMAQTDATSRDSASRLALEGRRVASGAEESSARTQLTQQQIAAAQRLGKLQAKLQSTTDEGERERIREQILLEQGKDKPMPPGRLLYVPGAKNQDGSQEPGVALDTATGQQVWPRPQNVASTSKAEYDKLPRGAKYIGTDGKTYIKG